ncbi:NADPH:quinone oxidoreductase family protein [Denitromonas iodatirespirans]|uniref:NADPH:quinone oxidoreductase family protein n=1 Tax=Denitromonas iodatirespirans TaxID=2795389 RepID=A0A944DCR3_DENI1|nr:NADPH:quinone oxidoreductase family protein [Denitromonas iodatirespirans]MBT0963830.1 NADPH:quinone oxidoreductase family protein [Denitromonas iodatirespirans]
MKAFVCHEFGPLGQHTPGELPTPVAGPGQVLIRVAAAGVNFYDTLIVQGKYQLQPPRPFAPGGEVAGVVTAVGEGVTRCAPGDRVMAFTRYGGYAEQALADEGMTWPLPAAVSFDTAAAGLITYGTAWFALQDLAALKPGETVLVLGAAGGVGLAALQIAKRAGARVIAAAGSEERLDLCRQHGADDTIDYAREDLKLATKTLTGGRGADVVVDVVGGDFTEQAVRAIAWRGRLLVIGFAAGAIPKIPANLLLLKGAVVAGVFWDEMLRREPDTGRRHINAITAAWADGSLAPPISARLPLARAAEALDALAGRRSAGKLIIEPGA